jgi:hypothetical protein
MIGPTIIDEKIRKAFILQEAVAWMEANNTAVTKEVIRMIQQDQLKRSGVDSENIVIGYYSQATEALTFGMKRAGDPYTLEDTGEFFRSMYVKVLMDSIIIDGDYAKMQDQDWWRNEILGLTDENLDKYTDKIKEGFIDYARKILEVN